jgi:isoquinoline 1-oxidoreductase subunit beta
MKVTRRAFLASVAASGGALTLGFALRAGPATATGSAPAEINAWIVTNPDNSVIIRIARTEMGQGVLTALPMLVAEELGCDWRQVRPEYATAHESLRRKRPWGDMSTGGSRSVRASQLALRQAGATAREMLIAAAAEQLKVAASECKADNGLVAHAPTGRSVRYGEIAEAAARQMPPKNVRLKPPSEWQLIGTPQRQLNALSKINGEAVYGIDVKLPGLLHAAIKHCPHFGGVLRSFDGDAVRAMPGIKQMVALEDAVAVVADHWWQAQQALQALPVVWSKAEQATSSSSASIAAFVAGGLDAEDADTGREQGDAEALIAKAKRRVTADYSVPFLAHMTLEPQNCTAHVTAKKVEVWAPTQNAESALGTAAAAAGVPPNRVVLHRTMLGGGFGRRGATQDFVREAVAIAKQVGRPVKLIWSREEDVRRDFYRPIAMARMTAALGADGMPEALKVRIAGQSIMAALAPGGMLATVDKHFLEGFTEDMPYAVENYLVDYAMRNTQVPVGFWRSVNYSQNVFFRESFVDEMAHAAGADAYAYRRALLNNEPRWLAALDAVTKAADWDKPRDKGVGRGIAINGAYGTVCAQVVDASVENGKVRVHRVVSAIDCGHVVNPLGVEMQTESAVAEGLSAALYGGIEIADGGVTQSNFHDYPLLRMDEMPRVQTVIVKGTASWGGVGETPLPPVAPALCNALFAATGKRIRALPIANFSF